MSDARRHAQCLEMKCFPFCTKGKVKPAEKVKHSKGRINVLPAHWDGKEGLDCKGGKGGDDGDFEYVVCSYETLDSEGKNSDCVREILSTGESFNASKRQRNESLRNCFSETEIIEEGQNVGSSVSSKQQKARPNEESKKENLGSLGRRVKMSRSLQDYIQEAKRKHLPSLHSSKKTDRGESDGKSGLRRTTGGPAGTGLVLVKRPDKTDESILLRGRKDPFTRQTLLLDLTLPRMLYQETRSASEDVQELELEEWKSIEDILAMDVSPSHRGHDVKKKLSKERVTKTESQRKFNVTSLRISESRSKTVNNVVASDQTTAGKQKDFAIFYDEEEIEMMEDIEKQFMAK